MTIVITFLIAWLLLWLLVNTSLSRFALDAPNHRSLHRQAIPRTGGVAIMLGLASTLCLPNVKLLLLLVYGLAAVSLLDDKFGLQVKWRFLAHIVAAAVFVFVDLPVGFVVQMFLLLAIVWMTNLYNFMDGSDGLAGGMAVFGFSAYAIGFHWAGEQALALVCASIVAASSVFLLFNYHPAKIFMGDGGSISLGFLAGALGCYGSAHHDWPWWFPLMVFSPFVLDATLTLLKRAIRREKVWQAHRSHYYQRLIQLGWGHRVTARLEYALMGICSVAALFGMQFPQYILAIMAVLSFSYLAMAVWIDLQWVKSMRNRLG